MARKSYKEETAVQDWFRRIDLSKEWRSSYEITWNKAIDFFKGKYFDELSEEDRICVNSVWPHVRDVVPAVYSRNPNITVSPRRLNGYFDLIAYKRAELLQRVLKYYIKDLKLKKEVKLCLIDGVLAGHSWIKTGYESSEKEMAEKPARTLVQELIDSVTNVLGFEERVITPNFNEQVSKDRPWIMRTSFRDIFVPAFSRRVEELPWIIERFILPHEEVLKNTRWKTTGLTPSTNGKEILAAIRGGKDKKLPEISDIEYDIIYEIWDGQKGKTCWICEGNNFYLEEGPTEFDYLDSRYHPYVMLRMGEVTDEFYPMGDVEPAEPQIKEVNEIRTQMNLHRRRFARKYFAKPGVLDEEAKAQLRSKEDGAVAELTEEAEDGPITDAVLPVVDAPMVPEAYAQESRAREDLYNTLGTTDYRSAAGGGPETATAASIQSQEGRTRISERIDSVNDFVLAIIRNLSMIVQRYHDKMQIADIVGGDARYWKTILDPEVLRNEYDFNIDYGSTQPINPEVAKANFKELYAITANDPYFNIVKLRIELVRQYGMEDPESWLNPQFVVQLEKQRVAMLRAGLLTEGVTNAPGSRQGPTRGRSQGQGEKLPTGQPRGLPGDRGGIPRGRQGGTDLGQPY